MFSDSLALPLFPRRPPRSAESEAGRWLRAPSLPKPPAAERSLRRLERRLRRKARRGRRIVLGTPELPYEPLVLGGAPLAALSAFDGLEIKLTTRSSQILEQLELLVELDQSHSVTIDVLVALAGPSSPDAAEALRAVASLSAQGLTTRLVVTDVPPLAALRDAAGRMRRLFEAAGEHRAFDVAVAARRGDGAADWRRLLRGWRLELGFPRPLPGRG